MRALLDINVIIALLDADWASPVFVDSGLSSFLLDHTVF